MATDYDAPRRTDDADLGEDSLEELKARRTDSQSGSVDVDEAEVAEGFELPGADYCTRNCLRYRRRARW